MTQRLLLIFAFLSSQLLQSQEIKTHTLFPPESQEHTDLQFLKEELEGKQLVMLGEMTHMYGNIFEMKARVIEYLHKELGYTTIAMESSMYDLWRIIQKIKNLTPGLLMKLFSGCGRILPNFRDL